MGQYWYPVNLDKREFVHPHRLGSGLKIAEQVGCFPGVGAALVILTAAQREPRGGGDLDMTENWHGPERTFPEHDARPGPMPESYAAIAVRTIGRWAGDRIAIVGDYAEESDLAPEHQAQRIHALCGSPADVEDAAAWRDRLAREAGNDEDAADEHRHEAAVLRGSKPFVDVTDDVCAVIEHELNGRFVGDGWRKFKRRGEE